MRLFRDGLGVRPAESVLVVADSKFLALGRRLLKSAEGLSRRARLELLGPPGPDGEPSGPVARRMAESDVVVAVTRRSLSHTRARLQACKAGARIVTLPNLSPVSWRNGGLTADPADLRRAARSVRRLVGCRSSFRVLASNGTDVRFRAGLRPWIVEDGQVRRPGQFDNLPAGEVATLPHNVRGTVVFDLFGLARGRLKLLIKESRVVRVEGVCPGLKEAFRRLGSRARRVAEFGLGCNPKARFIPNILESEKVLGSCHFALGSDVAFGGRNRVPFHRDGIIRKPTVEGDGQILVSEGRLVAPGAV